MDSEMIEMGKAHSEWAENHQRISSSFDKQMADIKTTYYKILMMRYEASVMGLHHLQMSKKLHLTKAIAADIQNQEQNSPPQSAE